MKFAYWFGLTSFCLGCMAEPAPTTEAPTTGVEIVTITARAGEHGVVDLLRDDVGYRLDPVHGPIELSSLEIVCPNGVSMPMAAWVAIQSASAGVDITSQWNDGVMMLGTPAIAPQIEDEAEACSNCGECSDGAYLCYPLTCGSSAGNDGSGDHNGHDMAAQYLEESGGKAPDPPH